MAARLARLTQVLLILLGVLSLRLVQLQFIQGARYARLSDRNRIRRLILPAPRGRIVDRNGVLLADTRPSFTVAVVPTPGTQSSSKIPPWARASLFEIKSPNPGPRILDGK